MSGMTVRLSTPSFNLVTLKQDLLQIAGQRQSIPVTGTMVANAHVTGTIENLTVPAICHWPTAWRTVSLTNRSLPI